MAEAPAFCPTCGARVPPEATACPECGADENTGWSEEARYQDLDVPTEDFDYQEFLKHEFSGSSPEKRRKQTWITIGVFLMLAAFVYLLLS